MIEFLHATLTWPKVCFLQFSGFLERIGYDKKAVETDQWNRKIIYSGIENPGNETFGELKIRGINHSGN